MFPVLSGVSIFCLVANGRGDAIRNIFGGASNNEGMGLLAACFDWNYIGEPLSFYYFPCSIHCRLIIGWSFIGGSTLWIPLKTQLNFLGGYIFTYIFMTALYYGEPRAFARRRLLPNYFFRREHMEGQKLSVHVPSSIL
jgi:hypothetical protein